MRATRILFVPTLLLLLALVAWVAHRTPEPQGLALASPPSATSPLWAEPDISHPAPGENIVLEREQDALVPAWLAAAGRPGPAYGPIEHAIAALDAASLPRVVAALEAAGAFGQGADWRLFECLLRRWAAVDVRAAMAFLARRDEDLATLGALTLARAPGADLNALSEAAATVPTSARGEYLGLFLAEIEKRLGFPAAAEWANTENSPEAEAALVTLWTARDPRAALHWLTQRHPSGLPVAAREIALGLASTAGDESLRWVATWPDAALREQTAGEVASRWAQADPAALERFLLSQKAEEIQPQAILALAFAIAPTRPADALRWTELIQEPAARERAAWGALDQWWQRDAPGLKAWLATSRLSANERQTILNQLAFGEGCCLGNTANE